MMTFDELLCYRVAMCPNDGPGHNHHDCPKLHNIDGAYGGPVLRRVPVAKSLDGKYTLLYFPAACRYTDKCPHANACKFSHNKKEMLYHPRTYKMLACKNGSRCPLSWCAFYHSTEELEFAKKQLTDRGIALKENQSEHDADALQLLPLPPPQQQKPDVSLNFSEALRAMHAYNLAQHHGLFSDARDGVLLREMLQRLVLLCANECSLAKEDFAGDELRREIAFKIRTILEVLLNMLLQHIDVDLAIVVEAPDIMAKLQTLRTRIAPAAVISPFIELANVAAPALHLSKPGQKPDRVIVGVCLEKLLLALKHTGTLLAQKVPAPDVDCNLQ